MFSTVIIANNIVKKTCRLPRAIDIKCSHHKKEMIQFCDRSDVVANAKVVIILQYINLPN